MAQILTLDAIHGRLSSRYPMLMLDRVSLESEKQAWAVKNISVNEPFFVGHFPNDKIVPGVLQVEAMKQLSELLAQPVFKAAPNQQIYIRVLEKVKFRAPQRPGDRMKIESEMIEMRDSEADFVCCCSNAQGASCEARMTLALRDVVRPDRMPELYSELDRRDGIALTTENIQKLLPHRYPFLLIDYVVSMAEEDAVVVKNLSINEELFKGVRADFPTVPESLQCEIVAQAGCVLVLSRPENQGKIGYFMTIDRAEFFAPVFAGDQLVCEAHLPAGKGRFGKGLGKLFVEGKLVGETRLMFAIVDPPAGA